MSATTAHLSSRPYSVATTSDNLSRVSSRENSLNGGCFSPILANQNGWESTTDSDDVEEADGESYRGYRYAPGPTECENFEMYTKEGLHPMLTWTFFADRYTIVHKLGAGASATVWLARDHVADRYVALKLVAACRSEHAEIEAANYRKLLDIMGEDFSQKYLLPLYDTFWFKGPNGKHLCISMGIAGPSLADLHRGNDQKLRADLINSVAADITEGLSRLHEAGFVYGDLSPANIAFTLQNLDGYSYGKLLDIFGEAEDIKINAAYGLRHYAKQHAPQYAYYPLSFEYGNEIALAGPKIKFLDFGGSYFAPPAAAIDSGGEFTRPYADPNTLLWDDQTSQESDMWALACILFELRAGHELFDTAFHYSSRDDVTRLIGPMPEDWRRREREMYAETDDSTSAGAQQPKHTDTAEASDIQTASDHFRHCDVSATSGDLLARNSALARLEDVLYAACIQKRDAVCSRLGVDLLRRLLIGLCCWSHADRQGRPCRHEPLQAHNVDTESIRSVPGSCITARTSPASTSSYVTAEPARLTSRTWRRKGKDPTLHGRLANIGNFHPWHRMTIDERREALAAYYGPDSDVSWSPESAPPPPAPLSKEELEDLEDLLSKLLTWRRTDRATAAEVQDHPWLTKRYAPLAEGRWLQTYCEGTGYEKDGVVYI